MTEVKVVPYRASWPAAFRLEHDEIVRLLNRDLVAVEHIGSTAVPGLAAKPVIDIMAVMTTFDSIDGAENPLRQLGYEALGEFGIPGRRYFRKDTLAGLRSHHLHCFHEGAPHVDRHLAFRDFLRSQPAVAAAYAELKFGLAVCHANDIEGYMDGKDAFIRQVEATALSWAKQMQRGA